LNFVLVNHPEVSTLVAAMLRARGAVERRLWSHPAVSVANLTGHIMQVTGGGMTADLYGLTQDITVNQPGYFIQTGGSAVMNLTGFDPTGGTWGLVFAPVNDPRPTVGGKASPT
jgi:hypothetical protein